MQSHPPIFTELPCPTLHVKIPFDEFAPILPTTSILPINSQRSNEIKYTLEIQCSRARFVEVAIVDLRIFLQSISFINSISVRNYRVVARYA